MKIAAIIVLFFASLNLTAQKNVVDIDLHFFRYGLFEDPIVDKRSKIEYQTRVSYFLNKNITIGIDYNQLNFFHSSGSNFHDSKLRLAGLGMGYNTYISEFLKIRFSLGVAKIDIESTDSYFYSPQYDFDIVRRIDNSDVYFIEHNYYDIYSSISFVQQITRYFNIQLQIRNYGVRGINKLVGFDDVNITCGLGFNLYSKSL
ncbi:hypothetical protein SAMN05661096_03486 [Marivirga sericea]|uniref:Outer membrane protein beta-barrel domain-containing protein n=1 Tax=Marivirga sericea TaxID=1028 RepID=A0A1X7L541_9BACT|nr:hypothetical protein [Marivirga sericea]SMG48503.1 hypothetical protein SAMN05661096_03486 [Marivirga sericea]